MDTIVTPVAEALLTCFCDALADNPNPPQHCCFRVGQQVAQEINELGIDACCEGIAYVKVNRRYASGQAFPAEDVLALNCMPLAWAVDFELGVFRCNPLSIDCTQQTNNFEQVQHDQDAMIQAMCCLAENPLVQAWIPGNWVPFDVLFGGCSGGAFNFIVQVDACPC